MKIEAPESDVLRVANEPVRTQNRFANLDETLVKVENVYERYSAIIEQQRALHEDYEASLKTQKTEQPIGKMGRRWSEKMLKIAEKHTKIVEDWSPIYSEYRQLEKRFSVEFYEPTTEKTERLASFMKKLSDQDVAFRNWQEKIRLLDREERQIRSRSDPREIKRTLEDLEGALAERDLALQQQQRLFN